MKISEIMAGDVEFVDADATVEEAALAMSDADVGSVPIVDAGRVVGVITDRDIVLRVVAECLMPGETPVTEVMTRDAIHCYEDDDVETAAGLMEENQVRRVFVYDREERLSGVVSLGDLALETSEGGAVLEKVSRSPSREPRTPDRSAAGAVESAGGSHIDSLVKGELSAIETYKQALEKLGGTRSAEELRRIEGEHETAAVLLKERMRRRGEEPPKSSGLWGAWSRAVEGAAKVLGGRAAIKALKEGEEHGVHDYEDALKDEALDPEVKALIRGTLLPQTRAHIPVLDRVLSEVR